MSIYLVPYTVSGVLSCAQVIYNAWVNDEDMNPIDGALCTSLQQTDVSIFERVVAICKRVAKTETKFDSSGNVVI